MFITFFSQCICYPVQKLLELLNSAEIKNYFFDGKATLWQVLVTFFVGALLVKFLLAPVRLSPRAISPVKSEASEGDSDG